MKSFNKITQAKIWAGLSVLLPFLFLAVYYLIDSRLVQIAESPFDPDRSRVAVLSAALLGLYCFWQTRLPRYTRFLFSPIYLFCAINLLGQYSGYLYQRLLADYIHQLYL